MSWKESDRMSERFEFVKLASLEGANVSLLCERFGISRKTGYKWIRRWRESNGDVGSGLADRSRRPRCSPARTDASIERDVLSIRTAHPSWGGRKIHKRLERLGMESPPSPSTITAILHRNGLISPEESAKHKAYSRWERSTPNELWQMDFKGEFPMTNGRKCYPLTILDDHSRYSLCIQACENQRRVTVRDQLREIFGRYGVPQAFYVDNGTPWGTSSRTSRHTKLSVWLLRQDIEVIHGKPYYPQGRGKLERFHRTLNCEVIQERDFADAASAQVAFDPWRTIYNYERPHEALSLQVPGDFYRPSDRIFRECVGLYDYDNRFAVRKTNPVGQLSFHGKRYKVSEALSSSRLGFAPTTSDGVWEIYYCRFVIGRLDERTGQLVRKEALD